MRFSSDGYGMNRAVLCLDNGEIYYHSEDGVFDERDEDEFDCDNFLVKEIFSHRGAYGRFKDLRISLLYEKRSFTLVQWIISPHNNGERAASGSDPGLIQWINSLEDKLG